MTTITDSFFAPKRDMEVRNTAKKATWRSLLVSSSIHVLGFVLVVLLSQYSLEKRRDYIQTQPNQTPIKAARYFPTTVTKEVENVEDTVPSKVEAQNALQPQKSAPKKEEISEVKQQPKKTNNEVAIPVQPAQEIPTTDTTTTNANQRAGQFNFSAKEAATQYFDAYNNDRLAQEAVDAAREYQQQKNSPTIVDPRKDKPIPDIPPRPVKRVNCTSGAAKTLALLSGITGGTLQCTNLGDPNKFIDARVKKRPNEGR
jgi:cytoskeletal protein RodZ